jgi:hypothetical protein
MARVIEQAGVSVAPTGSTGVQVNEFEAAIKSVTSSTTVGAVFVYDTRNDSDSGAWRKKARGSWYYEDLNTATRGGRREFPSVALIVADNDSSTRTVTIYDLDDPAMPMWLQFSGNNTLLYSTVNEITALNGRIYLGQNLYGAVIYDFVSDKIGRYRDNVANGGWKLPSSSIADRATTHSGVTGTFNAIVNSTVNDVAATYLEGGELDSLGLVRPVAALATDGGVSVIHPNGDVYDQTYTQNNNNKSGHVFWDGEGGLFFSTRESTDWVYLAYENQTLYSDKSSAPTKVFSPTTSSTGAVNFLGGNPVVAASRLSGSGFAVGGSLGLSLFKTNKGNPDESAFAYITSTYNTGYMLGDIRFAGLAGSGNAGQDVADRSVKANTLTKTGSITSTAVATSAELHAYSNFSASNYLSRANDTDFDFGTGDFSIMFWCKLADTVNATETVLERAYGGNALFNIDFASGVPRLIAYNGSAFDTTTGTRDLSDNQWHQLMCFRKSGVAYIYIDGKQHVSNAMTYDLDNSQAILHIGQTTGNGNPLANGSLSLLRISATAPTPQQVKEIYEAEKPLFRAGAKCLLAANQVNDLAYDSSTNLLHVASESTSSSKSFRGLEAVESLTSDGSFGLAASKPLDYVAASGGVVAGVGGDTSDADTSGCGVNLPPLDVRGDINTADSKLPDDGKIRFSGVTTDATITTIGQIPVAEGETYMVSAVLSGNQYQDHDGERIIKKTSRTFYRDIGGNILGRSTETTLTDETTASLDAILSYNTSPPAHNILIKVTGKAGTRMQWSAELTVQRISERSYER